MLIEKKDYNLIGLLEDELDMLESFNEYSGYLCDAISEVADSYIPLYNYAVWENASKISEYIEEAIESGIAPTEGDVDLIRIFQSGYYEYYSRSLHNNLDLLVYNIIADKVNEYQDKLNEDELDKLDLDSIENALETRIENYDHNNSFDDLDEIAEEIITDIKEEIESF